MYPELFRIFGYPISTFGVMMALGFLVSTWITMRRMRECGLDPEFATSALIYAMLGGILGAKLYYAIDVGLRTGEPMLSLILSREGITWYGGLIGGTIFVTVGCLINGISPRVFSACVCIGAAVGQGIGRIGCFLVGDDYGRPTDLPWGVSFPQGAPPIHIPVHPTQLYEMVWLFAVGGILWMRRRRSPFLFGEYFALNGVGRIFVEMLRVNPKVALGMTEPQWIGIGLIIFGVVGWVYYSRVRPQPAPA